MDLIKEEIKLDKNKVWPRLHVADPGSVPHDRLTEVLRKLLFKNHFGDWDTDQCLGGISRIPWPCGMYKQMWIAGKAAEGIHTVKLIRRLLTIMWKMINVSTVTVRWDFISRNYPCSLKNKLNRLQQWAGN